MLSHYELLNRIMGSFLTSNSLYKKIFRENTVLMEQKVNEVLTECWLRAMEATKLIEEMIANFQLAKVLNAAKQDCKRAENVINSFNFTPSAYTALNYIHNELTKHEKEIIVRMKYAQQHIIQQLHTPNIYKDWNDVENEVLKSLTDLHGLKTTISSVMQMSPVFK